MFLERQKALQTMYEGLKSNHAIRTSARVTSIQCTDDHVTVVASDGSSVTAGLVVGTDGVRSCVRKFIDSSQAEQVGQKAAGKWRERLPFIIPCHS
jgi:2-polyprenyl-6-methoxyphenol hydroxylase-like FAD-dependent oxidoreductase